MGLAEGIYVDTIVVSAVGALGTPTAIIDTLVMTSPPLGLDPTEGRGSAGAGTLLAISDSARVLLAGAGAETATWTATVTDSPWLTLTTSSGTGPGILRWSRDPTGLRSGIHVGTITVTSSTGAQATMTDIFTLTAPVVSMDCALDHLIASPCLNELQLRFLDLEGNGDGVYNLGDFLAMLSREGAGEGPEGRP